MIYKASLLSCTVQLKVEYLPKFENKFVSSTRRQLARRTCKVVLSRCAGVGLPIAAQPDRVDMALSTVCQLSVANSFRAW